MDPILSAILAVIPSLAAETVTAAVKDSYQAFKGLVQRKWGEQGDVTKTLAALEQAPHSEALANDLQRHAVACGFREDQDIQQAIKRLMDAIADKAIVPAESTVRFEQSGGTFTGVGAIGHNAGNIRFGSDG